MNSPPRIALLVVLALPAGCADDEAGDEALACTAGDVLACDCDDGAPGQALCRSDGTLTACDCAPARTLPCSAPGTRAPCRCRDGQGGESICLDTGAYTACDCAALVPADDGGATGAAGAIASDAGAPTGCPSGFSCVEQQGFFVCADATGFPPLCADDGDCAAAGLGQARCVDPGVSGVKVCVAPCQE